MSFDPMGMFGKMTETFTKLAEESTSRATAFWSEIEKADATRIERTSSAIDEMARLQKETLAYSAKMGAELRKISLDAMKQVASFASSANTAA